MTDTTIEAQGRALRAHALMHPVGEDYQLPEEATRIFQVGALRFRAGLVLVWPAGQPEPWWSVAIAAARGTTSMPTVEWTAEVIKLSDGIAMRLLGDAGHQGADHEAREANGMLMTYMRRASNADRLQLEQMLARVGALH